MAASHAVPHPADLPGPPERFEALTVRTAHQNSIYVVAPYGELDLATAPDVQRELDRAEASDAAELVLDLGGLTFVDSTGISLVVHACERSQADGDRLKLLPGQGGVQAVFELCGLTSRLPFVV